MKRKNVINVLISIIIVGILMFAFVSCDVNNEKEDSLSTTKVVVVPVIEEVTDEAGEPVTDAEGEKVTEVVGTTAVVVDEDEETPSFVQKPKPTKPNKPTTEKETEESTTKASETTKPKPQPTKPQPTQPKPTEPKPTQPKPTEKPDVEFEDKPAGSGGIDFSGMDDKPDTNHVGGETPEEVSQATQDTIDKNGWDMDWELN